MFSHIFLENTRLSNDIINIILEYKYDLDKKKRLDQIFKSDMLYSKSYFYYIIDSISDEDNDIIFLDTVFYYLKYYITPNDLISNYSFSFRIINSLDIQRKNYDFDKYSYKYSEIISKPYFCYYYYSLNQISFEKRYENNYNVTITLLDADDIKHEIMLKNNLKKSFIYKLLNFFRPFRL